MFLTEEQAAIIICDRSYVTKVPVTFFKSQEVKEELNRLRDEDRGIYCSVSLDTGAKLWYDKYQKAFYLSGSHPLMCDVMSIYDHLDILEDYYSWFLRHRKSVSKAIELAMRKRAYREYKLSRLKQVA